MYLNNQTLQNSIGQLLMSGRNFVGKEVYDLMLTTDILCTVSSIDKNEMVLSGIRQEDMCLLILCLQTLEFVRELLRVMFLS